MKESRQIVAAIDLRVRQLAAQGVSDAALVDQMMGYMASLQQLWTSTTDDELHALCQEYPGFVRYATLMEDLSERLRTGVGVPAHVKALAPIPEPIKRAMERLLSEGADLERALQERIDESGPRRHRVEVSPRQGRETGDLEKRFREWSAAIGPFVAEVRAAGLGGQTQELLLQGVDMMAGRIERLHETASSAEAVSEHSKVHRFRARMSINSTFMADFVAADAPCFALGLVEEQKRLSGFLALRPDRPIPAHVMEVGFRFGQGLIGTNEFEVIDFVFEFYGHVTYHALVNPNNPVVRRVLTLMVETQDYVFFTIDTSSGGVATCFRSQFHVAGLSENLQRIQRSTTTQAQYHRTVESYSRRLEPPGVMLSWVCRDNLDYLDLTRNRLEMSPS